MMKLVPLLAVLVTTTTTTATVAAFVVPLHRPSSSFGITTARRSSSSPSPTTDVAATATTTAATTTTTTDFDLDAYIKQRLPDIEKALDASVISTQPQTQKIVESMKYSLMAGGKRIRPVLCLAAAELFCDNEAEAKVRAMPTAVALEMIHTMSLIHDDLPSMDNDDLRRGKPTNHVVYGEDVAILSGDALLSTSFQHVAQHTQDVSPERILNVVVRLGQSVGPVGLAGGQVMDLECEGKTNVTINDLRWIHTHKTATLLQVAVASGAILGGATPEQVQRLETYALNIGLAFQVADDILDVTQSADELGKTAGKDEATDKTTYPKLLGLDGARAEAERLVAEAKNSLEPFGAKAAPLRALADYIINRKN